MKIDRTYHLSPGHRIAILRDEQGHEWKAPLRLKNGRWVYRLIDVEPYVRGRRGAA
jgi:hypothetical protein